MAKATLKLKNLAANATTTLVSGAGWIEGINFNIAGASSNTVVVYDNTAGSGTILASYSTTALGKQFIRGNFQTGLTVVIATGTAADITVSYTN